MLFEMKFITHDVEKMSLRKFVGEVLIQIFMIIGTIHSST